MTSPWLSRETVLALSYRAAMALFRMVTVSARVMGAAGRSSPSLPWT